IVNTPPKSIVSSVKKAEKVVARVSKAAVKAKAPVKKISGPATAGSGTSKPAVLKGKSVAAKKTLPVSVTNTGSTKTVARKPAAAKPATAKPNTSTSKGAHATKAVSATNPTLKSEGVTTATSTEKI
ncbi:MAG: hypothetical protein WC220_07080, partial [Pedobacter sp.]